MKRTHLLLLGPALVGAAALSSGLPAQDDPRPEAAPPAGQEGAEQGSPQGGTPEGATPAPRVLGGPGAGSGPQGAARQAMWYSPTPEDWKKPVLIRWERTWEDALEVSQETGRPILICVNMDGEIASEHYAGVRYRMPEIASIYEPYVCVIASVYRHNPRDFDEQGRRIPCPRFGTVTCGEHIQIEPVLFEQYFEGERVAPRHIMIELDRKEAYDIYYAFDTQSVFEVVHHGVKDREFDPRPSTDRPLLDRVTSRSSADRESVERAYLEGDGAARRQLMRAVVANPEARQSGLLRLAIFDLDLELNRLAREALAAADDPASVDLIALALRAPMRDAEREALIAALERIGRTDEKARNLAVVHRGLGADSRNVDVATWTSALGTAAPIAAYDQAATERRLEERAAAPPDPAASLEVAEATLAMAVEPRTVMHLAGNARKARDYQRLLFTDARNAAREAERLGASGWRVDAVIALTSYYLGDVPQARLRAEAAVAAMPEGDPSWNAMAILGIFAEARREAIGAAARERREWPAQWVTDVHSAYSVLAEHPLGTDDQVAMHHDFLRRFGAQGQASAALDRGLARFPESALLHARLRSRILAEQGVGGLEPAYARWLAQDEVSPNIVWFAGFASYVAAEFHRRANDPAAGIASYRKALELFDRFCAERPAERDSADHYAALCLGGLARVRMEQDDDTGALEHLIASLTRRPRSAAVVDGLNLSSAETARTLLGRLRAAERDEQAARLQAVLDAMDPEDLQRPEYERQSAGRGPVGFGEGGGGRRGRRRGPRGDQGGGERRDG